MPRVNLVLDNTLLGRNQIAQENNMKLAEGEEFDGLLSSGEIVRSDLEGGDPELGGGEADPEQPL